MEGQNILTAAYNTGFGASIFRAGSAINNYESFVGLRRKNS